MSDIFSLKIIYLTSEIGMAFKNFRIEHEVTAKTIVTKFSKSPSYITKLEKGEIKKIEANFFIDLCNFITKNNNGLTEFLSKVARNYTEFTNKTKLILKNVDDLLVEHDVTCIFLSEINEYIKSHDIKIDELVKEINKNTDLINKPLSDNDPENIWVTPIDNDDITSAYIKMNIPFLYVENFINGSVKTIHYVIAEAILYALYRLGNEKDAHTLANSKLKINHIQHYIWDNYITISNENIDTLFGGLQPDISEDLQSITYSLKVIANLTREHKYSAARIKQINSNLQNDLGFTFAYMSLNLEKLISKSKEKKQEFLQMLKALIEKYSQDEIEFDIYE